ncbi:uncharacterized protein LOC117191101 [Drosophila miranda]|uniref:uncharacterized protein LOC117191101 n=1 Tax=Drosophila miranda TaxID=7229 RepID=UPI00143F9A4C|nr:uncharacterized protein LOC117191101 [Drosophila miranda]
MAAVCLKWRDVIVMVWWQRHQKRPPFPPIWQEIVSVGGEAAVGGEALSVYWQWLSLNRRLGTSIGAARTHAFACAGDLGPDPPDRRMDRGRSIRRHPRRQLLHSPYRIRSPIWLRRHGAYLQLVVVMAVWMLLVECVHCPFDAPPHAYTNSNPNDQHQ